MEAPESREPPEVCEGCKAPTACPTPCAGGAAPGGGESTQVCGSALERAFLGIHALPKDELTPNPALLNGNAGQQSPPQTHIPASAPSLSHHQALQLSGNAERGTQEFLEGCGVDPRDV